MASVQMTSSLSVEQLLQAVDRLSPEEQTEFQRRLTARQASNGSQVADEAKLIQAARVRLPPTAERRLKKLIARSERGQLTARELADYRTLAEEAQRIDAARAEALAALAHRWGQSIQEVRSQIEQEGSTDGA